MKNYIYKFLATATVACLSWAMVLEQMLQGYQQGYVSLSVLLCIYTAFAIGLFIAFNTLDFN